MIRHVVHPRSLPARSLPVAVVEPPLVARPVSPSCMPSRPAAALAAAPQATVHVAPIAPPVHPELDAAVATHACSDLQWTSTRSKNWTPPPFGRMLSATTSLRCAAH